MNVVWVQCIQMRGAKRLLAFRAARPNRTLVWCECEMSPCFMSTAVPTSMFEQRDTHALMPHKSVYDSGSNLITLQCSCGVCIPLTSNEENH